VKPVYSKPILHGVNFCVRNKQFIQVKLTLTKISYIGTLFKVWYILDSSLFKVLLRQVSLYL